MSLAKPCIYIIREAADDHSIPVGASKLGGLPDLPPDFQWPYCDAKPLTFMGQFRFSDFSHLDPVGILPQKGILYCFIEADEIPLGNFGRREAWQTVFLMDENTQLVRTAHPTYQGRWRLINALPSHHIEYQACLSLPSIFINEQSDYGIEFRDIPGYSGSDDWNGPTELAAYWQLLDDLYPQPIHYWLGHPQQIQYYVEWDIVTVSQHIEPQKVAEYHYKYSDEKIAYIRSEMRKWQFLFQLDSDDSLNVMWGDVGTLYVGIPKVSLEQNRFEDCWTVMQGS